jgi:hypothetical protein
MTAQCDAIAGLFGDMAAQEFVPEKSWIAGRYRSSSWSRWATSATSMSWASCLKASLSGNLTSYGQELRSINRTTGTSWPNLHLSG